MAEQFCQSCGMPMGEDNSLYGTEASGGKSADYCMYCYQKGTFTAEQTMEEMIESCIPHMTTPESGMSAEQAREMMHSFLPHLKRWKKS